MDQKKVVVFGGSGFLGSHVADILTERNYLVTIFDQKKSPYIQKNQKMVVGNILDRKSVESILKGIDIVYNFSGISDIEEAKQNPLSTIENNILGNAILLDACQKQGVGHFLFASTVYVYSNSGSFYRTTKRACELLIEDYYKAYGIPFTMMRYGSLYGPRCGPNNWIYKILKQALEERKIVRLGTGEEMREYIHVSDAARISVDMLDDPQYKNQYVVISGSQMIKIRDILTMIREILNKKIEIEFIPPAYHEHYEMTPYSFNPEIAKKIMSTSYLDLGQGILDLLKNMYHAPNHEWTFDFSSASYRLYE